MRSTRVVSFFIFFLISRAFFGVLKIGLALQATIVIRSRLQTGNQ